MAKGDLGVLENAGVPGEAPPPPQAQAQGSFGPRAPRRERVLAVARSAADRTDFNTIDLTPGFDPSL